MRVTKICAVNFANNNPPTVIFTCLILSYEHTLVF